MGSKNIEPIFCRPFEINLKKINELLKEFPDRAKVVSLVTEKERKSWHVLIKKQKIPDQMD